MQYSYLPSWISTLLDKQKAQDAGSALYDAVWQRWKELPEDDRPQLVAFGLSLGAFGGESAFVGDDARSSAANLAERTEGALWVGSPHETQMWQQFTDARDAGSPYWEPAYDDGASVRFQTRQPSPNDLPATWDQPRTLFLQHPSDPVTFWGADWWWSKPGWMDEPRGGRRRPGRQLVPHRHRHPGRLRPDGRLQRTAGVRPRLPPRLRRRLEPGRAPTRLDRRRHGSVGAGPPRIVRGPRHAGSGQIGRAHV